MTSVDGAPRLVMGTESTGLRRSDLVGVTSRPAFAPGRVEAWVGVGAGVYRSVLVGSRIVSSPVQLPPAVVGQTVVALRLSAEGWRIAIVLRDTARRQQLYTGAVVRTATQVRIDSLQQISPDGVMITDLAWIDEQRLYAIGFDQPGDDAHLYQTGSDGSSWSEDGIGQLPGPPTWLTAASGERAWVSGAARCSSRSRATRGHPGDTTPALGSAPVYVESRYHASRAPRRRPQARSGSRPPSTTAAAAGDSARSRHGGPVTATLLAAVVDLVLPRHCVGCTSAGPALCPRCLPGAPAFVPGEPLPGSLVVAGGAYAGALRRRGARLQGTRAARSRPAARAACWAWRCCTPVAWSAVRSCSCRCPPARRRRPRAAVTTCCGSRRRAAAHERGPGGAGVLRLERAVLDSAGLGRVERERNLRGAWGPARRRRVRGAGPAARRHRRRPGPPCGRLPALCATPGGTSPAPRSSPRPSGTGRVRRPGADAPAIGHALAAPSEAV